jgi:hypothetical protein
VPTPYGTYFLGVSLAPHHGSYPLPHAFLFGSGDVPEPVKALFEEKLGVQRIQNPGLRATAYAYTAVPTRQDILRSVKDFVQTFGRDVSVTVDY